MKRKMPYCLTRLYLPRAVVLTIALHVVGCNLLSPGSGSAGPVAAIFTLTDTLGLPAKQFHSGDNFNMNFWMKNASRDTLWYSYPPPPVVFQIKKGDSVLATSIYGYLWPTYVGRGYLAPGDTLGLTWKAPNTPARSPQLVLAPGNYKATVSYPTFSGISYTGIPAIGFTIVQ